MVGNHAFPSRLLWTFSFLFIKEETKSTRFVRRYVLGSCIELRRITSNKETFNQDLYITNESTKEAKEKLQG